MREEERRRKEEEDRRRREAENNVSDPKKDFEEHMKMNVDTMPDCLLKY